MDRDRPDQWAQHIAATIASSGRNLTPGARQHLLLAVRDMAEVYRSIRRDHVPRCRCRAELLADIEREREQLAGLVQAVRAATDALERRLGEPLPEVAPVLEVVREEPPAFVMAIVSQP